jgi:hypothetical protein
LICISLVQIFHLIPSEQLDISFRTTSTWHAPVVVGFRPKSWSSGFWIWPKSCDLCSQSNGLPVTMQVSSLVKKNQENYLLISFGYVWLCGMTQNLAQYKISLQHTSFWHVRADSSQKNMLEVIILVDFDTRFYKK